MANHCFNSLQLKADSETVKSALAYLKGKDSDFDFNKIIPMPESIRATQRGSLSFASEAVCLYQNEGVINNHLKMMMAEAQIDEKQLQEAITDWLRRKRVDLGLGQQIIANRKRYCNCGDWYEWSIKKWGTKWEAWDVTVANDTVTFTTAWSPCSPVIEKIAGLFPKVQLVYQYFEPGAILAGKEIYINGKCLKAETYEPEDPPYDEIARLFGFGSDN